MAVKKIQVAEARGTVAPPTELADGQAKFRIRIIAGDVKGSSGYYPAEVVERDGPKAFPQGTHMHLDHQSFWDYFENPAGSLDDLAGVIDSTPVYEDGGLYADARVFSKYAALLSEMAPYIGISIRAAATSEPGVIDGEELDIITALIAGLTVDFVTHPGADGRIVEIFESKPELLPPGTKLVTHRETKTKIQPTKKVRKPMADLTEETATSLASAVQSLVTSMTAAAEAEAARVEALRVAKENAGKVDVEAVVAAAATALAASTLPPKAYPRVLAEVKAGKTIADAIKDEAEYLGEAATTKTKTGDGEKAPDLFVVVGEKDTKFGLDVDVEELGDDWTKRYMGRA